MEKSVPVYSNTSNIVSFRSGILVIMVWTASAMAHCHENSGKIPGNIFFLSSKRDIIHTETTRLGSISLIGHITDRTAYPSKIDLNFKDFVPIEQDINSIPSSLFNNGMTLIRCGISKDTLLPCEMSVWLVAFTANVNNGKIELNWETDYELNNKGFEVERSTDAYKWQKVGFMDGHGFTLESHRYTFTDHSPMPGLNYYRLKQVDTDGLNVYSWVVAARTVDPVDSFSVFPNPASGAVAILIRFDHAGRADLILYDHAGRVVRKKTIAINGNLVRTLLDLSGLITGVYLLELTAGNTKWKAQVAVINHR